MKGIGEETGFYELGQYWTLPGQRDNWVDPMKKEIIPFQVSKGIVIADSFVGEEEDDLYVWIRRFESEKDRKRLNEAVYETEHWKNHVAPRVTQAGQRRTMVTRIQPTDLSVLQ